MDAFRRYLHEHNLTLEEAGKRLNRSLSAVKKWGTARAYPPDVLPSIEAMTGGAVSGRQLRPDLYPQENGQYPVERRATPVGKLP